MSDPAGSGKKKILVVDDSRYIVASVSKTLREHGYTVIEATGGLEALEKARTEKPDCMLLDLLMPDIDGLRVLAGLKEEGLPVPAIILTADIQETTRKKCIEAGAAGFLNKPPRGDEMLAAIRKVTGE